MTGSVVHAADTAARDATRAERLAFEATARMNDLLAFADDAPLTPDAARLLLTACTFVQPAQRATMRDVRAACRGAAAAAPNAGPEEAVEARRRQAEVARTAQVTREAEVAREAAEAREAEEARKAKARAEEEATAREAAEEARKAKARAEEQATARAAAEEARKAKARAEEEAKARAEAESKTRGVGYVAKKVRLR